MKLKVVAIVGLLAATALGAQAPLTAPAWVKDALPIKAENIPPADYPYLANWIARNAKPADDYLIGLFRRHEVIVVGEGHNIREHKEFITNLVPRLYQDAGVRCIGWEFSNPTDNDKLERLTTAPRPDSIALLAFARAYAAGTWNAKEHWDLIEAVRRLNAGLPAGKEKMRFVGIDMKLDWPDIWTKIKTLPKESAERKTLNETYMRRDVVMAENAERETLARGVKALLFVGRGHDETHVGIPPDPPFERPIMGKILHDKYGDRVFQVSPDWGRFPILEKVAEVREGQAIGFDLYSSPFATILNDDMGKIDRPMANLARGYIYFGKREQLHKNTPIKGMVTEEMFKKYKNYYETDIGRKFTSVEEVNEWLEQRRWKQP